MSYRPKYLGHLNLYVQDVEGAEKFYADILGLHTYGRRPGHSVFMSADMEQAHEIALMKVRDDAPEPERGQVGLNHMAWKMETFDDLKEIHARLKEKGVLIENVADHGIAMGIYFRDPDGNGIEVYYELSREQWPDEVPYGTGDVMSISKFPWSL